MAKVVITRDRDTVGVPTKFLASDGTGKSVANKQEFKAVASQVKLEHNVTEISDLLLKNSNFDEVMDKTVRINPEFTYEEGVKTFIK